MDRVTPYRAQKMPHQKRIVGVDPSLMPQRPDPAATEENATSHHLPGSWLAWYSEAWRTVSVSMTPVITMSTPFVDAIQSTNLLRRAITNHGTHLPARVSLHADTVVGDRRSTVPRRPYLLVRLDLEADVDAGLLNVEGAPRPR